MGSRTIAAQVRTYLTDMLEGAGYHLQQWDRAKIYNITGKGVKGLLNLDEKNDHYTDQFIAIDNKRCFNKPSDCPIFLPIPKSQKQFAFLMKKMAWAGTSEAYKISNGFDYDNYIMEYPMR